LWAVHEPDAITPRTDLIGGGPASPIAGRPMTAFV